MLIPHHPNPPISREKDKPLYLRYWMPLAITPPFPFFFSSLEIFPRLLPKITPLSRENGNTYAAPSCIRVKGVCVCVGGGGGGGREIRTNMHDSGSNKAKSLAVAALARTLYVILRNLILTLKFHIVLARLCVNITAHFWCQIKEDELNFIAMKTILYKCFNFSGKITALSVSFLLGRTVQYHLHCCTKKQ